MKRKRKTRSDSHDAKRPKIEIQKDLPTGPLLRRYYNEVVTLRKYLASKLSKSSKKRYRKILHYGLEADQSLNSDVDDAVVKLLDTIVVGTFHQTEIQDVETIEKDITIFTQQVTQQNSGSTLTITSSRATLKQTEIVDFTIWLLFRRQQGTYTPSHILAQGYQKWANEHKNEMEPEPVSVPGIPDLFSSYPNKHVETLKSHPWTTLPALLGKDFERILGDLLILCGIFEPVENSSNVTQLSGIPLSELKPIKSGPVTTSGAVTPSYDGAKGVSKGEKRLSDIKFIRHRMLYSRPTLTGKGKIEFGLGKSHVLNRYCEIKNDEQTEHILKYVFPRRCGLDNVFESDVNAKDWTKVFKDYTLREEQISDSVQRWEQRRAANEQETLRTTPPLPKRLRSKIIMNLVCRLRKRHARCSYGTMLDHYCPNPLRARMITSTGTIEHASSVSQVSAFCRAVIFKVFPQEFLGTAEIKSHNLRSIARSIDLFVRIRRHESLSLHDVFQDIRIQGIDWLVPGNVDRAAKMSKTDFAKRKELATELLFYLFDSLLIPLIRGHFYVTESGVRGSQLFYFRHDVWKAISNPALIALKNSMLEEYKYKTVDLEKKLAKRKLGYSHIRLVPKEHGMRPIINLKRRVQKIKHGKMVLNKQSINGALKPAFSVLNYEKHIDVSRVASALFSVEDMYPRLQTFRRSLEQQGLVGEPLYFAKVDVKAAFDTIPQKRLLRLVRSIIGSESYRTATYSRAKLTGQNKNKPEFGVKPSWKYGIAKATTRNAEFNFDDEVRADAEGGRTRTVYVYGGVQKSEHRNTILNLLEEHVGSNLIKLGNRFYRQKEGIPQGSVVSTLLCSYFYAELERKVLDFVNDGQSILMRLVDDFLVISTKQSVAERFMHVMHEGIPEFGVKVKSEKSMANFNVEIRGKAISKLPAQTEFPYCGNAINTVTLDLSKDKARQLKKNIADSTSVEYSKSPGHELYRKIQEALKNQMHAMLLSTNYNSLTTVLSNLHHMFAEVAQKSYYYIRSLPTKKQPSADLIISKFAALMSQNVELDHPF